MSNPLSILPANVVTPSGSSIATLTALANKSGIAFYFSAHWCPPCRQFTPLLSELYRKFYKAKGLEVIFVSSDHDECAFREYHASMPWLAIPFSDERVRGTLSQMFRISGIPALIVVDSDGKVVDAKGRETAMRDSNGELMFGLKPKSAAFQGQAQTLGGTSGAAPSSLTPANVWIDRTKPVTKLQFKFPDGAKIIQEFNEDAKVSEIVTFASGCLGGRRVRLTAGFPPKDLIGVTSLKDADLFNAVVTVKMA